MKVNRMELIDRIEQIIIDREEKALKDKTEAFRKASGAEAEYLAAYQEEWTQLADLIRLRKRQGRAIVKEDLPRFLHNHGWSAGVFRPANLNDSQFAPQTEALTNLVAVLQTSTDEFISTSALERMGVSLKDLVRL